MLIQPSARFNPPTRTYMYNRIYALRRPFNYKIKRNSANCVENSPKIYINTCITYPAENNVFATKWPPSPILWSRRPLTKE